MLGAQRQGAELRLYRKEMAIPTPLKTTWTVWTNGNLDLGLERLNAV